MPHNLYFPFEVKSNITIFIGKVSLFNTMVCWDLFCCAANPFKQTKPQFFANSLHHHQAPSWMICAKNENIEWNNHTNGTYSSNIKQHFRISSSENSEMTVFSSRYLIWNVALPQSGILRRESKSKSTADPYGMCNSWALSRKPRKRICKPSLLWIICIFLISDGWLGSKSPLILTIFSNFSWTSLGINSGLVLMLYRIIFEIHISSSFKTAILICSQISVCCCLKSEEKNY